MSAEKLRPRIPSPRIPTPRIPTPRVAGARILNPRIVASTTARVLRQLRHDRRTLALIMVVPALLLALIYYASTPAAVFNHVGLIMLGIFPFVLMFLITSIAMLRERTSGTLERLLSTPLANSTYSSVTRSPSGWSPRSRPSCDRRRVLGLQPDHGRQRLAGLVLVASADGVLGMALGLLPGVRAYRVPGRAVHARDRVPATVPVRPVRTADEMAGASRDHRDVLPMTYAVRHSRKSAAPDPTALLWRDLGIVVGAAIVALALAAATLRRRTD